MRRCCLAARWTPRTRGTPAPGSSPTTPSASTRCAGHPRCISFVCLHVKSKRPAQLQTDPVRRTPALHQFRLPDQSSWPAQLQAQRAVGALPSSMLRLCTFACTLCYSRTSGPLLPHTLTYLHNKQLKRCPVMPCRQRGAPAGTDCRRTGRLRRRAAGSRPAVLLGACLSMAGTHPAMSAWMTCTC